jgi:hypothetical protein
MSNFPNLKTGAVQQYPARTVVEYRTEVVRFVDGSEQRFRDYKAPLRRWIISLTLLDETELSRLREFFREQRGAAGTFSFTDPADGTVYASCFLDGDAMTEELVDESKGRTQLVIRESRD